MKEITKTVTKKYNEQGILVEEIETIVEKEYQDNISNYPLYTPPLYQNLAIYGY